MRTLKALLLTLLLSSCVQIPEKPIDNSARTASQEAPATKLTGFGIGDQNSCDGYIEGNYYTYCHKREYIVHKNQKDREEFFESLEKAEEMEEAEE